MNDCTFIMYIMLMVLYFNFTIQNIIFLKIGYSIEINTKYVMTLQRLLYFITEAIIWENCVSNDTLFSLNCPG